jgi:hypothetical protein
MFLCLAINNVKPFNKTRKISTEEKSRMKLQNKKGTSRIILIVLLLISFTVGAILSYMYTVGYYISKGYKIPEDRSALVITDVDFQPENAKSFTLTVLNPSYSPDPKATVTTVAIKPEKENKLYNITDTNPSFPHDIERATSRTFKCNKNWGEFAGQTITIYLYAVNASGATYSCKTPFVKLIVEEAVFDPSISVKQFNITLQNSPESATTLNITEIFAVPPIENVTPSILNPYPLAPGEDVVFNCEWNWAQIDEATITVRTQQGYALKCETGELHKAAVTISDVYLNEADTDHFNVTVWNQADTPQSKHYINITKTVVIAANGTQLHQTELNLGVNGNSSITFRCLWDWRNYRNENITVIVYTKQGFICSHETLTPPSVILEISGDPYFNLDDTSHFNITIQNSPHSLRTANITEITAADTIITGNDTNPSLISPYPLGINKTISFNCTWQTWSPYKGKNVTITVHYYDNLTLEEFETSCTFMIPFANITNVVFNSTTEGIKYFNVTVHNTLSKNVTVAKIFVMLGGNETFKIDATSIFSPLELVATQTTTLICVWNWTEYEGEEVNITIYTTEELKVTFIGLVQK